VDEAERDQDSPDSEESPSEEATDLDSSPPSDRADDEFARAVAEAERELPRLPPPPRWQRQLTVVAMAVTAIACALLAWSLRADALYALSASEPLDLGDLRVAELGAAHANRYVRGYAHLETAPVVQYARKSEHDRYRLLPVAGAPAIWVEHRVPKEMDGPRFVAPSRVAGRLVPVERLGLRHRGVAEAVHQAQAEGRGGAWLLLEGVDPQSQRWVLALAVMLALFAAWNLWGIARILRRLGAETA
jgi:hypothetical protein